MLTLAFLIGPFAVKAQPTNPNYDKALADSLGADDYGMKSYTLVVLESGERESDDRDFVRQCFAGHMANISLLVEQGKLLVAGPMGANDKGYRGIFILNTADSTEAAAMLQADPAISEGFLDAVQYPWYGSAALGTYLHAADKIWKTKP